MQSVTHHAAPTSVPKQTGMEASIPKAMRALVVKSTSEAPSINIVPTPVAVHASAVVKILSAGVLSYVRDIYNGKRGHAFPTPLIAGTSAVGRVVSVGSDATKLKPGDLVLVDPIIRSRDGTTSSLRGFIKVLQRDPTSSCAMSSVTGRMQSTVVHHSRISMS